MKTFLLLAFISIGHCLYAQSEFSEADINKMAAQAEATLKQAKKNPKLKAELDDYANEDKPKTFPKKPAVPFSEKILTDAELTDYLKKLYVAYKSKMPAAAAGAQQAEAKLGNDPAKAGLVAIGNWYNGAPQEGILMAMNAAAKKPEDVLLLNNLAALLNIGGASKHALPILQMLVAKYPQNAMFLNNLGQAYAGVGELDKAMLYFGRCIQKSPNHPEANNTAGQIEKSRGNMQKATAYFQASLAGAQNVGAREGLDEANNNEGYTWLPPMGSPVDFPYFNGFKYKFPRQCKSVAEAPYVGQEHEDYEQFIGDMISAYSNLYGQESSAAEKELQETNAARQQIIMAALKTRKVPAALPALGSPVAYAALRKLKDLMFVIQKEEAAYQLKMDHLKQDYQQAILNYENKSKALAESYVEKTKGIECGEGQGKGCMQIEAIMKAGCRAQIDLANTAMQVVGAIKQDMQKKGLIWLRYKFNRLAYYRYLGGLNKHQANAFYYEEAKNYLTGLQQLARDPFTITMSCDPNQIVTTTPKKESDETKGMDCPIDISMKFIIGKIKLNCEKFEFSGGEGLIFKLEKNFVTRQSTMSIAAGVQFEAEKEWGIFSTSFSAELTQSLYVTWDGDNNFSDAGMALKAEASLELKAAAGVPLPGVLNDDYMEKSLKVEGSMGYTLGINSGWTPDDACLNKIADAIGLFK